MKKTTLELLMAGVLLAGSYLTARQSGVLVSNMSGVAREVIVIDAGHGGSDPGKIGVNNAQEKEINLSIAKKLAAVLEKGNIHTVLTRENDDGLSSLDATNKKAQDMQKRCQIIDETKPLCTVSIHQNSYEEESANGAQVFFYSESKEGKELAQCIQEAMNTAFSFERPRTIKANNNYYMLKRTTSPSVIVECGFLSNWKEAKLLVTDDYQEKIAQTIGNALIQYVKSVTDSTG